MHVSEPCSPPHVPVVCCTLVTVVSLFSGVLRVSEPRSPPDAVPGQLYGVCLADGSCLQESLVCGAGGLCVCRQQYYEKDLSCGRLCQAELLHM